MKAGETKVVGRPRGADEEGHAGKGNVVADSAVTVTSHYRVVRFRGRPMVMKHEPYPHYTPLHREGFDRIAYPILGGVSRSRMGDVYAFLSNTAEDYTDLEDRVLFGLVDPDERYYHREARVKVWNMRTLEFEDVDDYVDVVWRCPYGVIEGDEPVKFVMDLAGNDMGVYEDIMQSMATMLMMKKPDGVIWWVGDGANGKSTLMDALYRLFPGQLASITVKRLVDGRDTPSLNGTLANVVKESSEGRIEDTEIYKSIGTHENFRVHKFHSQDDVEIRGNIHHIFSANTIPTLNDKGWSARRRTFVVPFNQRFDSDPTFEERTFTPYMFGRLIAEICKYATRLARQGYKYKWSAATLSAKSEYDADANNAEVYAKQLIDEGVVAFTTYNLLRTDYENWCADNGYVPLGVGNLRKAFQAVGFDRVTARQEDSTSKIWRLGNIGNVRLEQLHFRRPGLLTTEGFAVQKTAEEQNKPYQASIKGLEVEEQEVESSRIDDYEPILKGEW